MTSNAQSSHPLRRGSCDTAEPTRSREHTSRPHPSLGQLVVSNSYNAPPQYVRE